MGEKKEEETQAVEKLDKLIDRMDGLLAVLKLVAEDLKQLSDSLKPYAQKVAPSTAPPAAQPQILTVESVKESFPEDLQSLLSFQEQEEFIVIRPRGFLGSENFARIADVVKKLGGEYVSAGKDSRFRVPKQR
jgi:hypothetical protein